MHNTKRPRAFAMINSSAGKLGSHIFRVQNSLSNVPIEEDHTAMTGSAYDFKGATISLTDGRISSSKKVTLVRHGLSSWNNESRVQVLFLDACY